MPISSLCIPRSSEPFLIHKKHCQTLRFPLQLVSLITFSPPDTWEGRYHQRHFLIKFPRDGLAKPSWEAQAFFAHTYHIPTDKWASLSPGADCFLMTGRIGDSKERMEYICGFQIDWLQLLFPGGISFICHHLPQAVSSFNKAPGPPTTSQALCLLGGGAEIQEFPG